MCEAGQRTVAQIAAEADGLGARVRRTRSRHATVHVLVYEPARRGGRMVAPEGGEAPAMGGR
jgi:hypothetical protein